MADKKEASRLRKAASRKKLENEGRGRLEILPPPKIENHSRIRRFAEKVEAESEIENRQEDW